MTKSAAPTNDAEWDSSLDDGDDATEIESATPEAAVETPPAADVAPAVDDGTSPADAPDAGVESPDSPAVTTAPVTTQPTAPEAPKTEPFRYTLDRRSIEVPGAVRVPGKGIVISEEAWARHIQPNLRDGKATRDQIEALNRQVAERDPERHPDILRARFIAEKFDELLGNPEKFDAFVQDFERNAETLRLQAENLILTEGNKVRETETQTAAQEKASADLREKYAVGFPRALQAVLNEEGFKDLGLNAQELHSRIWPLWQQWAFIAEEGDGSGLQPGEPGIRLKFIREYLEPTRQYAERTKKQREAADAAAAEAAKAAKKNEQLLGRRPGAPITTPSRGAPAVGKKRTKITNAQEWEDWGTSDED